MDMDYKRDMFSLGKNIFKGMKEYVLQELGTKYESLKIITYSVSNKYPQIVFSDERIPTLSQTTRNELTLRRPEFEINIYAINATINGIPMTADDIVNEISNVVMYYLQKICRFKDVNLTNRLTNFDDKGVQSRRAVIRFTVRWLQELNKIK